MSSNPFQNIWGNPEIDEGTKVGAFVEIGSLPDHPTIIGRNCSIQAFVFICPGVTIEDEVFIGPRVTFLNDKYPPSYGRHWLKVTVGKGASIGGGSIILPGITIGEFAVIGAGSVVTKSVPPHETWVGLPASELTKRE